VTYTSQIIHLLVLTKSSEYFLLLARLTWSNELGDFKGWVTLRLNFGPLDRGMVILYNFVAEGFTQRNFVADFIRLKLKFV